MSPDIVPCPQVNGVCVEGKQHADVVAAIKAGGDETRLLVVDVLTDEFFKKCKVVPSEEHLAGGLGLCCREGGLCQLCQLCVTLLPNVGVLGESPSAGRWRSHHPGAKQGHLALAPSWCGRGPHARAVRLMWALWEGRFMALGCTLAGFMVWGVSRQQLFFALLHSLGSALAPSLLSRWSLGGWGGGVSLGSVLGLSSWGCSRCPAASPHAVGLSARGGLKKIGTG